jgi:predicted DNA-binding ribbon-helix-helix protein
VGEDQESGVDGRGGRQTVDQLLQVEGTVVDLEKHFWQTLQQIYLNLKSSEAR